MNTKFLYLLLPVAFSSTIACSLSRAVSSNENLDIQCIEAAKDGSLQEVISLIKRGASVGARDAGGRTALHWAAVNGHSSCLQALAEAGADLDALDAAGKNALKLAAVNGKISCIQTYVKAKHEVGRLLIDAAKKGSVQEITALLKRGASIEFRNESGNTAAYYATQHGHTDCVKILSESKANERNVPQSSSGTLSAPAPQVPVVSQEEFTDTEDESDELPKEEKALRVTPKKKHVFSMEYVTDSDEDYDDKPNIARTNSGTFEKDARNVLQSSSSMSGRVPQFPRNSSMKAPYVPPFLPATQQSFHKVRGEAPTDDEVELNDLMKSIPQTSDAVSHLNHLGAAQVSVPSNAEIEAFFKAIEKGDAGSLSDLIASGIAVDVRNADGATALHLAAKKGDKRTLVLLIKAGADVNVRDKDTKTPLHLAATFGHSTCMTLLSEAGAELIARDKSGNTALRMGSEYPFCMRAYLDAKYALNAQLVEAARTGCSTAMIARLLKQGARINAQNICGATALHYCAEDGRLDSMNLLIAAEAEVSRRDKVGDTPLHIAAYYGHSKCVQALINAKAPINACDNDGYTPLHVAAENGQAESVALLLDGGADSEILCTEGTALDLATKKGPRLCVEILTQAASKVAAKKSTPASTPAVQK